MQERKKWPADELARTLQIQLSSLRRRIAFWQTQGLIKEEEGDVYSLAESGVHSNAGTASTNTSVMMDEAEAMVTTSEDQRVEELEVFWKYIVNMLINLTSLPLDRIHQMLKLFAMQAPSQGQGKGQSGEYEIGELRDFLDKKVQEHELIFVGGEYKLPPK